MSRVCILTDSSAQFSTPNFQGHELVTVLPLNILFKDKLYQDGAELSIKHLPISARGGSELRVLPPDRETLRTSLMALGEVYENILIILLSAHLNPATAAVEQIIASIHCPAHTYLIDSQSMGVGLGLLVEEVAAAALEEMEISTILHLTYNLIPRVYTIFCTQNLSYLHNLGQLDPAQALVGELMGIIPFFVMEGGRMLPIQKARNPRALVDIFHNFITEFSALRHIALIYGAPFFTNEAHLLRERILNEFPNIPLIDQVMNFATAAMLGPRSLGVVTMIN